MKQIKIRYLIILGIIITIIIVALSTVINMNYRNLTQKAELKAGLVNLSQTIENSEDRLTDAVTDTTNTSASYLAIQSTLKLAVISAKKIYANPNHTLIEINKSSDRLSTAFGVFDNSPVLSSGYSNTTITTPDTTNYSY